MAGKLFIIGRVLFFALLMAQCSLLVKNVVNYDGNNIYWLLVLCFLPGIIAWLVVMKKTNGRIRWLWLIWLFYTWFALTPMVGLIFGRIVIAKGPPNSTAKDVFGPRNVLKATPCLTPVLMLLLLHSTPDSFEYEKYREPLNLLSFTVTLDLFDGIAMLEVLLDKDDNSNGPEPIPGELKIALLVFVCVFFFSSPLELLQVKFGENGEYKIRKKVLCIRSFFQALTNLSFLIIRFVLWFMYNRNAPIFLTKNGISLTLLLLEVLSKFGIIIITRK